MAGKNPCFNCKDREIGCHDWCDRYRKFQEINEQIKRSRRVDPADEYVIDQKFKNHAKYGR